MLVSGCQGPCHRTGMRLRKGIPRSCGNQSFPSMATYIYQTIPKTEGEEPRRFEVQQKMSDPALTIDPESGLPVKRVITGGSGVIFSGTSILSMKSKGSR
ncbi:MAG: putative nucleic acid-binding Zn ribbon protein [Verrucomicrobiales bacterium]|jgi:predicted nucleic acid-binding Zn ribbon protein